MNKILLVLLSTTLAACDPCVATVRVHASRCGDGELPSCAWLKHHDPTSCEPLDSLAANACSHDPCEVGSALVATCDVCVAAVCESDAECCDESWSAACSEAAEELCACS